MTSGPPVGARSVGRTSLTLVPLALLARGVAFLVPALVAQWFGVGRITDAWFWALAFPTFALVLASTSLGSAITPVLARVRQERPADLPEVLGGLLVWAALGAALPGLLLCLLGPTLLTHATRFDPPTIALAGRFLWGLLPFMTLTTAAAVLRVACEVHASFTAVALTPILRAGTVILTTWAAIPSLGPMALPLGLGMGEVTQFGFWTAVLARRHGLMPRPSLRLDPAVRRVGRDLAPILGGEVLVAMNLIVDKAFAATLGEGSVATLEYADRARVIPQTLLESTLLMVAFSTWARLFARGELERARANARRSLSWVLALASPALAGMFIGREVLVGLLFERGAFTAADRQATADLLAWYLPGVLPNLLGILAVRAHIVERNLGLVLRLGLLSLVANTVFNALLIGPLGLRGLALGSTITMFLVPGLYLWALLRRWPAPSPEERRLEARSRWIALASLGVAVLVEWRFGAPTALTSPVLWAAALPCLGLLGLSLLRPPRAAGG